MNISQHLTTAPVGSIVVYAGLTTTSTSGSQAGTVNIEETGWMVCDGRELRTIEYPQLYMALGLNYSPASDASDNGEEPENFNIPNLTCSIGQDNGANPKSKQAKCSYIIKFA